MLVLCEVGKNPTKMIDYFQLMYELCILDGRFIEWFRANKLGPRLIHFFMQKESPLEGLLPQYPYYMSEAKTDSFTVLI
jgi:hypothetical protein